MDKQLGATFTYKDGEQQLLVAGDGTVTNLTEKGIVDVRYGETGSEGLFVAVKNADGKCGVIDWHGNTVVDFVLGGFEVPVPGGGPAVLVRAFNVLRQYDETQVADAWAPYLTMAEGIRIAAKAFTTDPSLLSCCA